MPKYIWIEVEDWAGLYKDGKCVLEGHSLPEREVARELDVQYVYDEGEIDAYLMEHGRFPDDINDLPGVTDGKLPE